MEFTADKAIDIIKTPKHKSNIDSAKTQESQLRVFTEELDESELNSEIYWLKFKRIMKTRSPKKADRICDFLRYPLPAAEICDSILSEFFKVFDGKNRNFHIDADRDISWLNKWIIDAELELWIEESAKKVFKSMPCSFVVVDKDENGRPYKILVDSERLVDAEIINTKGQCGYIAFVHSYTETTTKYCFYDAKRYFVFEKQNSSDTWTTLIDQPHGVGYCPGTTFISQASNSKNNFKRSVAFTKSLSKLEDWSYFDVFRNYTDHYVPFPVTEAPVSKCPNENCVDGMVRVEQINPGNVDEPVVKFHKCEACEARGGDLIGPGTHIGIRVRESKDENDGSGVFKMIFPETEHMKYIPEKLDDLELEIRHKTVGLNYMASMNEAMNQMQLKGSFASMESVLMRTKAELDHIYIWITTTVAKMQYKDIQLKVDANFGTEFYLVNEDDLQRRFKEAKDSGLPQEEQMMIYLQLIETKYKGNANKVARQKMLIQLDPMPLFDVKEAMELKAQNVIDAETLSMKVNFLNFISKFETENGPIMQFGLLLAPEKRIEKIKAELERYNTNAMAKIPPAPVLPTPVLPTPPIPAKV